MDQRELREKNLNTIKQFLECTGPERKHTRRPLFTESARKEMELREPGGQATMQDVSAFEWLELTADLVPDWGFYENHIYQCEDPNLFLVRSYGRGNFIVEGERRASLKCYVNEFLMEDGKIRRFRETVDPCELWYDSKTLTIQELCDKNRETVDRFLRRGCESREAAGAFFADEATVELKLYLQEELIACTLPVGEFLERAAGSVRSWAFRDATVFTGTDPNKFIAKANGAGTIRRGGEEIDAALSFLMEFRLLDGEIVYWRTISDPCEQLRLRGRAE